MNGSFLTKLRPWLQAIATSSLLLLSSCSGVLDVRVCRIENEVGFELTAPGTFFGHYTPRPHRVWVSEYPFTEPYDQRVMWETEHYANVEPDTTKRPLVLYGQLLPGFSVLKGPKQLRIGSQYYVGIDAGPDVGGAEFVYSAALPTCTQRAEA